MPSTPPYTIPGITLAAITAGLDAATTKLLTEDYTTVTNLNTQAIYSNALQQCLNKVAEAKALVQSLIA